MPLELSSHCNNLCPTAGGKGKLVATKELNTGGAAGACRKNSMSPAGRRTSKDACAWRVQLRTAQAHAACKFFRPESEAL